jgi:hypothetical protein
MTVFDAFWHKFALSKRGASAYSLFLDPRFGKPPLLDLKRKLPSRERALEPRTGDVIVDQAH